MTAEVSGDAGHCAFSRTEGSTSRHLLIEVEPVSATYKTLCASRSAPLKAIGNEAFACSFEGKPGEIAEQVVGRVRNQMFLVRVSTSERGAQAAALREKARKVAEQVAGILF